MFSNKYFSEHINNIIIFNILCAHLFSLPLFLLLHDLLFHSPNLTFLFSIINDISETQNQEHVHLLKY